MKLRPLLLALCLGGAHASPAADAPAAVADVIDLGAPSAELVPVPSHVDLVSVSRADDGAGLDIRVAPGAASYPGIIFRLEPTAPDLSAHGHVEARVTNTCEEILNVSLRVDSAADPARGVPAGTATGVAYLRPGESGAARVYFAVPKKGSAPIDPTRVAKIFVFIGKDAEKPRRFRLDGVVAGGSPGEKPAAFASPSRD